MPAGLLSFLNVLPHRTSPSPSARVARTEAGSCPGESALVPAALTPVCSLAPRLPRRLAVVQEFSSPPVPLLSMPLLALEFLNLRATRCGMWALSSPARELSCTPAVEAWSTNRWVSRRVPALEFPEDLYLRTIHPPGHVARPTVSLVISLIGSVVNPGSQAQHRDSFLQQDFFFRTALSMV